MAASGARPKHRRAQYMPQAGTTRWEASGSRASREAVAQDPSRFVFLSRVSAPCSSVSSAAALARCTVRRRAVQLRAQKTVSSGPTTTSRPSFAPPGSWIDSCSLSRGRAFRMSASTRAQSLGQYGALRERRSRAGQSCELDEVEGRKEEEKRDAPYASSSFSPGPPP